MSAEDLPAGIYQHYKGGLFEVLGIADEPGTSNRFVVYQSLGITENLLEDDPAGPKLGHRVVRNGSKGALTVCSIERFFERVDGGDYSGGKRVPRFRLLSGNQGS